MQLGRQIRPCRADHTDSTYPGLSEQQQQYVKELLAWEKKVKVKDESLKQTKSIGQVSFVMLFSRIPLTTAVVTVSTRALF